MEFLGHVNGKHFDHFYDKVVGKPKSLPPADKQQEQEQDQEKTKTSDNYDGPFREKRSRRNSESYATYERNGIRSSSQDAWVYTRTDTFDDSRAPSQRRKYRNTLPAPEPELELNLGRGNLLTERSLRKQELLLPPKKNLLLEKGLPPKEDLLLVYKSKSNKSRRDSAMASGYRDDYRESGYRGENDRPRSQPPRGRYYDDEDSDYDERTGDRHRGGGRGYDDRDDYDTVKETREVYRGPAQNRPWGPERNESGRSDYSSAPYGAGAVAQYGRKSDTNLDRSYVTRREKSRGRDSYRSRSRSYSRSPSRSRSRSGSGIRGKLEETFSTRPAGLGAGLAGAVIGGLAGREFGHKHKNRDIIIGAVVGGLAANAGENKWREYKDNKEREISRDVERYERPYDGRSRSNMR